MIRYKDFYSHLFTEVYIPLAKNYWLDKHGIMHRTSTHNEWVYNKYPEGFDAYTGYLKRPDLYEDFYDYAYKKGNIRVIIVPTEGGEHSNGAMYYSYSKSFGISNNQLRKLKDYAIENGYELKNEEGHLDESYTFQYDGSYKVKDPEDLMGEKTVDTQHFKMEDSVGGRMSGYVMNNDTVYIVMMQSIPPNTPFEDSDKYKRRGFFKGALQEFKKKGIKHVVINLQSSDTRGAIQKLLSSGLLKNPRNMRGGSFDEHPTKFDIV